MISTDAIKDAAENAIEEARTRSAVAAQQRGINPPPPSPFPEPMMPPEYSSALMHSLDNPDQYAAILQRFLAAQSIPFPRHVFKRRFYEVSHFILSQKPSSYPGSQKPGRPDKRKEAREMAKLWHDRGRPSFGQFARQIYKNTSATELKRQADRLQKQIRSVVPREKTRI